MILKDNDNFVENSDIIELYLKELKYFSEIEGGLLTKEEEDKLGYRILEGDKEAINTIVKRNLRLVISVAKHYKDFGLDFVDLIQHGNIGLIEAAERYDVRRGLGNEAKNIRVPVYFYEELKKYKKVKDKLTVKYKRYPTEEELAKELNISLEKLKQYEMNFDDTLSLNFSSGEDKDTEIIELISDNSKTPEEEILDIDLKEKVDKILNSNMLTPREVEIIRLRFGFEERIYTLEEIGQKMGVTRERIRQIEQNALKKLRNYKTKNLIGAYLPMTDIEIEERITSSKSYRKSRKK